jgi:hypothetical protein
MEGQKSLTTEEMELERIKSHGKFKARPLRKELFTRVTGLPSVERLPCTTDFNEFKLSSHRVIFERPISTLDQELEECKKQFRARELNKAILE